MALSKPLVVAVVAGETTSHSKHGSTIAPLSSLIANPNDKSIDAWSATEVTLALKRTPIKPTATDFDSVFFDNRDTVEPVHEQLRRALKLPRGEFIVAAQYSGVVECATKRVRRAPAPTHGINVIVVRRLPGWSYIAGEVCITLSNERRKAIVNPHFVVPFIHCQSPSGKCVVLATVHLPGASKTEIERVQQEIKTSSALTLGLGPLLTDDTVIIVGGDFNWTQGNDAVRDAARKAAGFFEAHKADNALGALVRGAQCVGIATMQLTNWPSNHHALHVLHFTAAYGSAHPTQRTNPTQLSAPPATPTPPPAVHAPQVPTSPPTVVHFDAHIERLYVNRRMTLGAIAELLGCSRGNPSRGFEAIKDGRSKTCTLTRALSVLGGIP